MKTGQLVNSQSWLQKLLTVEMEIKKAYTLRKFILEVNDKLKAFNQLREDLIKKYWEEKDWQTKVKDEFINKFFEEINIISEEEIEIEIPDISIDDLSWKIDTDTLLQLDYLIK